MSRLSECEEMTMAIIWNNTEHMALQEIMDRVNRANGKKWKPQTVSTYLSRLRGKNVVSMYRKGRYAYYVPEISIEDYRKEELIRVAKVLFGGNMDKLVECAAGLVGETGKEQENV